MTFVAVNELKQGAALWGRLERERELVVTRDGKPCAILVGVDSGNVEDTLAAIRQARFSSAVSRARRRAIEVPPPAGLVEQAVKESRRSRRGA